MAESRAMNSYSAVEQKDDCKTEEECIKTEVEISVKSEIVECLVCTMRTNDGYDICATSTTASGSSIQDFLSHFTQVDISQSSSRYVCKTCFDLINVLEQAEMEYCKLKEAFEAILKKNPFFELAIPQPITLVPVKDEISPEVEEQDSEDEPLARTKKKRNSKIDKRKRTSFKIESKHKRKTISNISWQCNECAVSFSDPGGSDALAAHKISVHTITGTPEIKTEDSADGERSQSPYNNGLANGIEDAFGPLDDDDDSSFNPDDFSNLDSKKKEKKRIIGCKKVKQWHYCDQCNAKYTSLVRLEQHKLKHDGSKPPYICEICGAHYKHKRACDIHIQLHKGISDWKCEECNKLFPSKGSLARHNNIHTGKLNYQCDLCGKSFIHTSSFKMHKLSHSGVKPHACDVCGLALMTRSHLKRHKRIHSGEKRHECAVCGKRFSERYNLVAHAKSHEAGEAGAGAAGAAPAAPAAAAPAEPRRRLFRCLFCAERFERRYMLERHAGAAHGRTLERPPATPRNTMSKLLKAQAAAKREPAPAAAAAPAPASKLLAQLTSSTSSLLASGSWSGAYAAEFGLRADFPH